MPTDGRYDEARRLYNGMIDKRPLMIARCSNVADVIAAIGYGRDHGLLMAVRGGGHNSAGLGSWDNGLVIDLSGMTGVRVDPGPANSPAGRVTNGTPCIPTRWAART